MNNAKRGMIPPISLFFMFVICRIVICLTYVQSVTTGKLTSDMVISSALALLITAIVSLPAIFCVVKNKNPLDIKGINIFYGIYFIFLAVINVSRFSYFASTRLNPGSSGWLFAFMITIAAAYIAYLGIEGISRFSSFAFILIGIAILFLLFFSKDNFYLINFFPFGTTSSREIITDAAIMSTDTVEIVLLLSLSSKVNGNSIKPYLFSMTLAYVIIGIIFAFVAGVLGDFASLQSFPVYSLAQLANLGDFERLDAVYMVFWIFAMLIKVSLLLYGATICVKKFSHGKSTIAVGVLSFAAEVVATSILTPSNFNYLAVIIPFVIFSIIIPLIALVVKKNKGDKVIEKN